MKKLFISAAAAIAFTALGGLGGSTNAATAANYNQNCVFKKQQPNFGTPIKNRIGGDKWVEKDGRVFLRVNVTGKNCKQVASFVSWKSESLIGQPYISQQMYRSKQIEFVSGKSYLISIAIPKSGDLKCFYQIDLVRGANPEGSNGGGAYSKERMIFSVRAGEESCIKTPVTETPEEPEAPVVETPVTDTPATETVAATELVKTGPASVIATFIAVTAVAAVSYALYARRLTRN
jgi:hypothetical protein